MCSYILISDFTNFAGRFQIPFPLPSPNAPFEQFPHAATLRPPPPLEVPLQPESQMIMMQQQQQPGEAAEQYQLSQNLLQHPSPQGGAGGDFWFYPVEGHGNCEQHYSDVNEGYVGQRAKFRGCMVLHAVDWASFKHRP